MKDFVYLVQGESKLVKNYFRLKKRENADVLFLTYDEKLPGCLYFPDSTWAEGRNYLLKCAEENSDYLYFIFCDDDINFLSGSWDCFEKLLLKYKPGVAVPVVTRLKHTVLSFDAEFQSFKTNDEPLMAFHKNVVHERILLPYVTKFDKYSWWGSCIIQQILIQTYYNKCAVQFNGVVIDNEEHGRYEIEGYGVKLHQNIVRSWLREKLENYKDISLRKSRIVIFYRTMVMYFSYLVNGNLIRAVKPEAVRRFLMKDS